MGSCSPILRVLRRQYPISEVRTVCVSSASTGPCGGQRVNRCPYRDRSIVNRPPPRSYTAPSHRTGYRAASAFASRSSAVTSGALETIASATYIAS